MASGQSFGYKPVAMLAVGTLAPLVATLAPTELGALAVGGGLAIALVRMTFDPSTSTHPSLVAEEYALKNAVMTSTANRSTRIALGLVYLYASYTFAVKLTMANESGQTLLARLLLHEPKAYGSLSVAFTGCLVDNCSEKALILGLWAGVLLCFCTHTHGHRTARVPPSQTSPASGCRPAPTANEAEGMGRPPSGILTGASGVRCPRSLSHASSSAPRTASLCAAGGSGRPPPRASSARASRSPERGSIFDRQRNGRASVMMVRQPNVTAYEETSCRA